MTLSSTAWWRNIMWLEAGLLALIYIPLTIDYAWRGEWFWATWWIILTSFLLQMLIESYDKGYKP